MPSLGPKRSAPRHADYGTHRGRIVRALLFAVMPLIWPSVARAADFHCAGGDVHCLIDAINVSNSNGEPNTIRLDAGTYTLTAPDNVLPPPFAFGNGFPIITGRMAITGAAADHTIIERANYRTDLVTNAFRFFNVAASGELGLGRLTLRGGNTGMNSLAGNAGAILSHGSLTISDSAVTDNFAALAGAVQIANGTFTLRDSRVERNNVDLGGDIVSIGNRLGATGPFGPVSATIERTTFADNRMLDGGVISSSTTASTRITDTTVAGYRIGNGDGGAIVAFGPVFISNATLIDNTGGHGHLVFIGGADTLVVNSTIVNNLGSVTGLFRVQNSIIAGNRGELPGECAGGLVSLGHNLIGDPRGCTTVLPSDLTGDAGLGSFVTGGHPGGGHVPLLADSRAIDAADPGRMPGHGSTPARPPGRRQWRRCSRLRHRCRGVLSGGQ